MGGVVRSAGKLKKVGRATGLNKVVRKGKKAVKKGTKFVGKAAKKVGKFADKATGGVVGNFKKTGLGKLGQGVINTLPRVASRIYER